jgi:hypothetical protein
MEQELDITEEFQFPDMAVEAPADPMRVNRLSTYAALASSDKVTDVEFAEEYDELKVNYHEVLRNGGENEVRSLMEDKLRRDTETLFSTFAMETLEQTSRLKVILLQELWTSLMLTRKKNHTPLKN